MWNTEELRNLVTFKIIIHFSTIIEKEAYRRTSATVSFHIRGSYISLLTTENVEYRRISETSETSVFSY